MKLTHKHNNKAIKSGMTLLELTVVILVLLSLIAILFVGARAWKKGSDKSANIMNVRNIQQAVRGYENMNTLAAGAALPSTIVFDATTGFLKEPKTPLGAAYSYLSTVSAAGVLYVTNPAVDGPEYWYSTAIVSPATTSEIQDKTGTW